MTLSSFQCTSENENRRVAAHILRAERRARRAPPESDPLRALVRRLLLDELGDYRRAGRFPRNPLFERRTPFFVDAAGVPCAVAHLLAASGELGLVERIATKRNNALVEELVSEPRLVAWLDAAGISLSEAAAIQPSYSYAPADSLCGGPFEMGLFNGDLPGDGVLDAHVVAPSPEAGVNVVIDATYGDVDAYAIGETVNVQRVDGLGGQLSVSGRILVLVKTETSAGDGGPPPLQGISVAPDGSWQSTRTPSLVAPLETTVAALTESDCTAVLHDQDPRWTKREKVGVGLGCHCAAALDSDVPPTTVGILIALVAAVAARRRRSAARRNNARDSA